MTIGGRIREIRKSKGLTQKALGELSGTAETTVRQYEGGKRTPRLEQVEKIAKALGVAPFQIMGMEYWDNKYPNIEKEADEYEKFVFYLNSLDFIVNEVSEPTVKEVANFDVPEEFKKEYGDVEYVEAECYLFDLIKGGKTVTLTDIEFKELQTATKDVIETRFYKKLMEAQKQNKKPSE